MSVLLVSRFGELCPLAPRIGAGVFLTNRWYRERGLYRGLVDLAPSLQAGLRDKPDAIIFDHTGDADEHTGALADTLRARGIPVWGASGICDLLESDRAFGIAVMAKCGIRIPRTVFFGASSGDDPSSVKFSDKQRIYRVRGHLDEARKFVSANGGRFVLKPYDASTDLTYVAKDAEDMEARLAHAQEAKEITPDQKFLLQEYVKGIEVSTEIWVSGGSVVGRPNHTIELKKAFPGDLGPNIGCATSTVWAVTPGDRCYTQTLGRDEFLGWLRNPTGPGGRVYPPYHAPLDLNCIVSEEDHQPYGIEWTPRFGYSAIFAWLELLEEQNDRMFVDLAEGRGVGGFGIKHGFAYSLQVTIPPMPISDNYVPPEKPEDWAFSEKLMEKATHVRIGGPVEDDHVWLIDAQADGDDYRTAGTSGLVMEITGTGAKVEEARDSAHGLFEQIELPDKYARTVDGGNRAIVDMARLKDWGVADIP